MSIVSPTPPESDKTDKEALADDEMIDLLNNSYKPDADTQQIALCTMQSCLSRIKAAINARWTQVNPRIGSEGYVLIAVRFNASGQMVNCRLIQGCGNNTSDAAALTVVKSVGPVSGLDTDFLCKFAKEDLLIRYKVESR